MFNFLKSSLVTYSLAELDELFVAAISKLPVVAQIG